MVIVTIVLHNSKRAWSPKRQGYNNGDDDANNNDSMLNYDNMFKSDNDNDDNSNNTYVYIYTYILIMMIIIPCVESKTTALQYTIITYTMCYNIISHIIVEYNILLYIHSISPKQQRGRERTGQDKTKHTKTGQDNTGEERTGQDNTGKDRQGRAFGLGRAGHHRACATLDRTAYLTSSSQYSVACSKQLIGGAQIVVARLFHSIRCLQI